MEAVLATDHFRKHLEGLTQHTEEVALLCLWGD